MQEKELKIILPDKNSYLKLIKYLNSPISDIIQINHYFDTEDNLLAKKGLMIRVRQENSNSILTIKSGSLAGNGIFIADEYEYFISEMILLKLLSNKYHIKNVIPTNLLEKFNLIEFDIIYKGWLINNRKKFKWHDTTLIVDKSYFLDDTIDYEVELETKEPSKYLLEIKRFFNNLKIDWHTQDKTKYERFLRSLYKLK